jgi:hypothetical protein
MQSRARAFGHKGKATDPLHRQTMWVGQRRNTVVCKVAEIG